MPCRDLTAYIWEANFGEVRQLIQDIAGVALVTFGQPGALDAAAAAHRRLTELFSPHIETKRRDPANDGLSFYATTTAISGKP